MRPGTDSKNRQLDHGLLPTASLIACALVCTTGIGCNAHRNNQTVMMHQSSDVCLNDQCSLGEPAVNLGAAEYAGMPCESCPTGGITYEQNQWSGSACSTADCNGSCDSTCQQCNYEIPRELKKVSLPDYVVEPPDILLIEVSRGQKLANAKIRPGELLNVRVGNTLPVDTFDDPVSRAFKQIDDTYRVRRFSCRDQLTRQISQSPASILSAPTERFRWASMVRSTFPGRRSVRLDRPFSATLLTTSISPRFTSTSSLTTAKSFTS